VITAMAGFEVAVAFPFVGGGEDRRFISQAPNALIASLESVLGDQILPDGHGIVISTQTQLDDFPEGLTAARRTHSLDKKWKPWWEVSEVNQRNRDFASVVPALRSA
jgi:hypothetical protein